MAGRPESMPGSLLQKHFLGLWLAALLLLLGPSTAQYDEDMEDMDDMEGMGGMDDEGDEDEMGGGGGGGGGGTPQGCVKFDSLTLDKVVEVPGYAVLVKFDTASPSGDQEEEYKTLCGLAYEVPKFFVGEVRVNGDDETESNEDLVKRFALSQKEFPSYLLFNGKDKVIPYKGKVTAADIATFLRRQGIKMKAVGTIAELDDIAARFAGGKGTDADVEEAEKLAAGEFKDDRKAPVYVRIMKSIQKKGISYAATEAARVEKILGGSISDEKRAELSEKLRILGMFAVKPDGKEEL